MYPTYMPPLSPLEQILNELESEFNFSSGIEFADVNTPGIPGRENHWFPSQGEARKAAIKRSRELGLGYGIAHDPKPARGLPHYHILDASGNRVSGHYFYGKKPPRRVLKGRPNREAEARFRSELEAELEVISEFIETDRPEYMARPKLTPAERKARHQAERRGGGLINYFKQELDKSGRSGGAIGAKAKVKAGQELIRMANAKNDPKVPGLATNILLQNAYKIHGDMLEKRGNAGLHK